MPHKPRKRRFRPYFGPDLPGRSRPKYKVTGLKAYDYGDSWSSLAQECKRLANFVCRECGRSFKNNPEKLAAHHIIPLSKGGKSCQANLVCLCEDCHRKRHLHLHNAKRVRR